MRWILFSLSAVVSLAATLNVVRAPDTTLGWKLALVVGEFGHWLVLVPLALAGVAAWTTTGSWRLAILGGCALAVAGLVRPAVSAARLTDRFDWVRLYRLGPEPRGSVRPEVYARPGGQEMKLDFYAPALRQDTTRRPPCLVVIHGGGWDSGDNTQLTAWNHRWAARGWAVAALNYRLAPAHPWPAARDDVRAAIAWLKANADRLGLDPERLVILGRSAGGQIATAVAYGEIDPAVRGVIALYAPHDMTFAWGVSREDDALNSVKLMRQYLGGPPDNPERTALYESASGQHLAGRHSPPTLLVHGYPDRLVWYRHSRRLAARLQELGVPHTHVELPWATHAFDYNPDGPGGQVADAAIAGFLDQVGR
jgi:acetyl esterase/lipase